MYLSPNVGNEESDNNCSEIIDLRIELLQIYLDTFLHAAVLPSLLTSGEQQTLSSQILARKMLVELLQISTRGPLAITTARFLIGNKELIKVLISRAGSVNRGVSVSSLQLLSSLIGAAPLEDASALILQGFEVKSSLIDDIIDYENEEKSFENIELFNSRDIGLNEEDNSYSKDVKSTSVTLDSKLAQICGAIDASKLFNASPVHHSSASSNQADIESSLAVPDDEYAESAAEGILARLTGRLSSLIAFVRSNETRSPSKDMRNEVSSSSNLILENRGPLMELVLLKLKGFLSLQFEEQLAVTGLIERCICLISSIIISTPNSGPKELGYLELIVEIMNRVDELWSEELVHLRKIPDYGQKLRNFKRALTSSKSDLRKRKLVERQPSNVEKILETGVVVRELLAEVRGHIMAVRELRLGLGEISSGLFDISIDHDPIIDRSFIGNYFNESDSDEPDFQTDLENVNSNQELNEDVFYSDLSILESKLNEILDSL